MKLGRIITAAALAMMLCGGTALAQDCGCGTGHAHFGGHHHGWGHGCRRAWTYDEALALWDGYCFEQSCGGYDDCGHGCGLLGGGLLGGGSHCGSRWPQGDCGGCGDACGFSFCLGSRVRGIGSGLFGGGCGCGGFGWGDNCGCDSGCDDQCGCAGHHHGIDLFAGLRCRTGCGLLSGRGVCGTGCGCDAAPHVHAGCGCN
jgi:hypothetical protein